MAEQNISNLVGNNVVNEINELVSALERASKAFTPLMEELRKTSNEISKAGKDITSMVEAFNKYNAAMTNSQNAIKQYNELQEQLANAKRKLAGLDKEQLVTLEQLKEQIAAQIAQAKEQVTQEAATAKTTENATRQKIQARQESQRYQQQIKRELDQEKNGESTYRAKSALLAQLKERYKDAGEELKKTLIPQIQKLDKELKEEDATLGNHTRNVGNYGSALKSLIPQLSRFTAGFGALGIAVLALNKIFNQLASAIKYGIQVNKEFEQSNANLASILGKTRNETQALQEQSILLGRTTEYTATQIVKAQTELAKLGFGQNTILNITEPLLGFSTALGASLPQAAQVAGQTLRAFNLASTETEEVLSLLTLAANRSAMDFSFLERSIAIVGASASVAGVSLKDTLSLLGVLSNSGLDASRAATALRNIFLYLVDDSKKLGKELKGVSLDAKGISDAFVDLRKKGIDLADMFQLTDKRAVNALAVLIQNAEQVLVLRNELDELTGTLETIRNTRLDTLEGDLILLKSAWDGFWLSFRENSPFIRSVIQTLTDLINKLAGARESALQRGEGNQQYASDLVDQTYIDSRVDDAQRRLRAASEAYQAVLDDSEKANEAYQNLIKVRQEIARESGEIALRAAERVRNNASFLREQAESISDTGARNRVLGIANRYETVDQLRQQKTDIQAQIKDIEKTLDTEDLSFEVRLDRKRTIEGLKEDLKSVEKDTSSALNQLQTAFENATRLSNSGSLASYQTNSKGISDQARITQLLKPLRDELRVIQGEFLTAERAYLAVVDTINENERTDAVQGSGEGFNIQSDKERNKAEQERKRRQQLADKEEQAALKNRMREFEQTAKQFDAISKDNANGWERQTDAAKAYERYMRNIIELQRENKDLDIQRNAKNANIGLTGKVVDQSVVDPITGQPQTDLEKATLNQRLDNYDQYETKIIELENATSKQLSLIQKNRVKEELASFKDGLTERLRAIERNREEELKTLARLQRKGDIGSTEYRQERAQTNVRFDQAVVDETKLYYEQWLSQQDVPDTLKDAMQKAFQNYMNAAAKSLSSSTVSYEEETGRQYSTSSKRSTGQRLRNFFGNGVKRDENGDIDEDGSINRGARAGSALAGFLNSKEVKIVTGLYDDLTNVVAGFYDLEIAKIDQVIAKRREYYEQEQTALSERLENLENNYRASLLSEESYNDQRTQIQLQQKELQKQQDAEEKELEAEKRKLQVQQAKWNKANNIAQAAMNTAVAVSNALTVQPFPLGLALSVVAGAIGAAQIALISSQQIPQYAKGTDFHKGGAMVVGDGGKHEYVQTPSGDVFKTPDTPTLMSAPQGTKVFSDDTMFLQYLLGMQSLVTKEQQKQDIRVHTDPENKRYLRSINEGVGKLRENERYKINLVRREKMFSQW